MPPVSKSMRSRKSRIAASSASAKKKRKEIDYSDLLPEPLQRAQVDSSMKSMRSRIEAAGLDVEDFYDDDLPELPSDITEVDHDDLSNILLSYQSAFSVAVTQTSAAHIESETMKEIADYLHDKRLLSSDQSNDSKRKAEAATADEVVYFRAKARSANNAYIAWRDQSNSLAGKIKAISRVGGFKDDENEASDATARIKQTKGTVKRRRSRND